MKNKKKEQIKALTINGEKLKNDLPDNYSHSGISTKILGKSVTFLHACLKSGKMKDEDLDRLCFVFNLNKDDYIITEAPESKKEENVVMPTATVDTSELSGKIDTAIEIIGKLCESMESLVALQTNTQKKLDSILNAIDKNTSNVILGNEMLKINFDSIDTEMAKTNSSLNIIKGRLADISNNTSANTLKKGA